MQNKTQTFTVGIIGMGLIGGSMARAYTAAGHRVYIHDLSPEVCLQAMACGAADGELDAYLGLGGHLDCLFIALYPEATVKTLTDLAPRLDSGTLVIDTCGVKRTVCAACHAIAAEHGFTFLGGHPMAGSHFSGFAAGRATLFRDASMILVPPEGMDSASAEAAIARAEQLLAPLDFGSITVCTAEHHDAMIAYTSQLAHVVSNAYVKSPTAQAHKGYSAGSYKDLTRVAYLNAPMWTELFLDNRDNLIRELDGIIAALGQYRDAMANADADLLCTLLEEGKRCKESAK
ncbi:MAG: prephenate dehydrogenase [Clostridia bacterium]|nr:prephenate dehydrogenase [Clostridia bacterium]